MKAFYENGVAIPDFTQQLGGQEYRVQSATYVHGLAQDFSITVVEKAQNGSNKVASSKERAKRKFQEYLELALIDIESVCAKRGIEFDSQVAPNPIEDFIDIAVIWARTFATERGVTDAVRVLSKSPSIYRKYKRDERLHFNSGRRLKTCRNVYSAIGNAMLEEFSLRKL